MSLFSGIEGASVAWKPLGWTCAATAEIEPFGASLIAHYYPEVPNFGDVTKITEEQVKSLGNLDIVVFGFPCQDLSVAGLRAGLKNKDGGNTRSGLFFDAMRIVRWANPRWAVAENVPGLFSSNEGRDFAAVVGEMAGVDINVPDGGWANSGVAVGPDGLVEWCVLDAQFFGVPQRRRRVFIVRDSGNWRDRPPLFLERHSLQGDTPPSRKAWESVAGTIKGGSGERGYPDPSDGNGGGLISFESSSWGGGSETDIAPTLDARCKDGAMRNQTALSIAYMSSGIAEYKEGVGTLRSEGGDCGGGSENLVANCLETTCHDWSRADGFNMVTHSLTSACSKGATEDGTGRGTPLTVMTLGHSQSNGLGIYETETANTLEGLSSANQAVTVPTLVSNGDAHSGYRDERGLVTAFDTTQITSPGNYSHPQTGDPCHPLTAGAHVPAITVGEDYADAYEADSSSILSTLRKAVGTEAVEEWGLGILAALQQEEILQSWLHGKSLRLSSDKFRRWVDDSPSPRTQGSAGTTLRKVWKEGPDGRTPQGRGLAKQLINQLGEAVSKLPHERSSASQKLRDMWEAAEGFGVLQQALHQIQEVRRSERSPVMAVRRLTPTECEALQGFPRNYTLIPHRGKPAADGPRYKALGNSWAVPVVRWIGKRILEVANVTA